MRDCMSGVFGGGRGCERGGFARKLVDSRIPSLVVRITCKCSVYHTFRCRIPQPSQIAASSVFKPAPTLSSTACFLLSLIRSTILAVAATISTNSPLDSAGGAIRMRNSPPLVCGCGVHTGPLPRKEPEQASCKQFPLGPDGIVKSKSANALRKFDSDATIRDRAEHIVARSR